MTYDFHPEAEEEFLSAINPHSRLIDASAALSG